MSAFGSSVDLPVPCHSEFLRPKSTLNPPIVVVAQIKKVSTCNTLSFLHTCWSCISNQTTTVAASGRPQRLSCSVNRPRLRISKPERFAPTARPTTHMMSWQPQQEGLNEVLAMLRQTSSDDTEVQRAVAQVSEGPFHVHAHSSHVRQLMNSTLVHLPFFNSSPLVSICSSYSAWKNFASSQTSSPIYHMS